MRIKSFGRQLLASSARRQARGPRREHSQRTIRIAIIGGCAVVLLVLILLSMREEPQLMNSAEIATLRQTGIVKIGVRTDVPGMAMDGEGLEIELAKRLCARLLPGSDPVYSLKLVPVTSSTVTAKLSDGSIDVAVSMLQKDAQSAQYAYSTSYYADTCRIVVKKNAVAEVSAGTAIGCIQNSAGAKLLEAYTLAHADLDLKVLTYAALPDMLLSLQNGTLEAAVISDLQINKYQEEYDFNKTAILLGTIDYAIACPVDTGAIVRVADIMLKELRESGDLEAMHRIHGLPQN